MTQIINSYYIKYDALLFSKNFLIGKKYKIQTPIRVLVLKNDGNVYDTFAFCDFI